jgi:hypothetical protein
MRLDYIQHRVLLATGFTSDPDAAIPVLSGIEEDDSLHPGDIITMRGTQPGWNPKRRFDSMM